MKKLLSLTLTFLIILSLFSSCVIHIPTNNKTDSGTNTANTNTTTDNSPDKVEGNVSKLQFNYDYGFHIENKLTLLVDSSHLGRGFESIEIPDDIVAGDIINIVHTGSIVTLESYPGQSYLENGEVISYSFSYAYVIHYMKETFNIETIKSSYDYDDAYVILDRTGKYVSLDEYTGDEIYLVVDQEKYQYKQNGASSNADKEAPDEIIPIASMFAYNPRDLEDGQVTSISSSEALRIAEEHFYYNYAEDGIGFEYSTGMGDHSDGNWEVFFKKLYTNGTIGEAYYYTIDKATGEILSISIEKDNLIDDSIKTSRFMYTFAYWHIYDTLTGEAYATLLCDDSYINIDIQEPLNITAGDMLIVEHTGDFITAETYPGSTSLYNGEVVSYRFEYSTVYTLFGEEVDSEAIRNKYDFRWGDYYVILNREGDFVSLDEYDGEIIYLVLDKERAEKIDKNEIQPSWDETKIPIACALAYNPRDLEDGKPVKTVAELRNEKVTIDLDYHEMGDMLEKEETEADITKHQFGYIGTNESGNKYIIYAPNVYSYYVSIKCTDDFSDVVDVIRKIEFDYFNRAHTGSNDEMHIDTVELFDSEILITFPDFDSYALCQEELLNKLSELDSVLKIKVSYLNIQDGSDAVENPYEYINLGYYYKLEEENRLFSTYEEFCEAFENGLPSAEKLDVITAETFESYYVFMIISTYSGGTYGFDISDAKVDGNRVFFTTNKYIKSGIHDMWQATDYCIVLVPKQELGELPNDISSVIDMQVGVYIDGNVKTPIDIGDAILIAQNHFFATYDTTLPEGFIYTAKWIDGENDDYWYILIYQKDINNPENLIVGGCFTYIINKSTGEIVDIEAGE
ncbi:MAG: hypothetical protein J6A96_01420 [Clostridia bacterium]|nr:hypothetical protein [Clostridia bacterium]